MTEPVFVDSNVFLHYAYPNIGDDPPETRQQKYEACREQIDRYLVEGTQIWINGQVIREFWRNASLIKTRNRPIPVESVSQELDRILGIVTIADNHLEVRKQLLMLLQDFTIRGIAVHDANIVATMLAYNIDKICTLDNDFHRYRRLITIVSPLTSTA
ncbi:MAG: type II toxin-antitoxin system VapC family toxin [Anaerolineaceae bacterium]|nr:type II toxin-antitoxin system VapC family toxin [Anaerolineaceae bacterium]